MKLLYLSIISFIFISSSALLLSGQEEEIKNIFANNQKQKIEKTFTPIPILKLDTSFPVFSAEAALAIDLDSMVPLYEKNPDSPLLPASTTKIVTALVAIDYFSPETVLIVDGIKVDGQKMGLILGEKITVGSLLDGLLIFSANDAAEVLAKNFPGGREAFIEAMNKKAKDLNLENTHFENPVGLDGEGHVSTARDLIRVAIVAMQNPYFSSIVRQKEKVVTSSDNRFIHNLVSTNKLIGSVEGVLGVKTGWTENARENLITYIERDGRKVIIALLGSQDRFGETKELIDWIFKNYQWKEVIYSSDINY